MHLAALPMAAAYFVTQQIYAGWSLFGIVLFGGLVANLAHTDRAAQAGPIIRLSARLIFAFFVWTFPTNQATNNWTVSTILAPPLWNRFADTGLLHAMRFGQPLL